MKKIVCLGGGIGTVNLIKGLKEYTKNITVVSSMADDGGSTGRLRRLYNILPPGDLVSCMAAMSNNQILSDILTYRFPGKRYTKDEDLAGHKLGNLIMVAMCDKTDDFNKAILLFQKTFAIPGRFLPATKAAVTISALTTEGKEVKREEAIDLGKYRGKKEIERVRLHPADVKSSRGVVEAMEQADVIIAGPGDLYTTILPTLIIPDIAAQLKKTKKRKIFIINITNKPTETNEYSIQNYIKAVETHLGIFPFDTILINNNFLYAIPTKWQKSYKYVSEKNKPYKKVRFIKKDLVDKNFSLYHSSKKVAKAVLEII